MASGCSLGWLPFLVDRDKSLVLARISESREDRKNYLYINITISFASITIALVTQIILAQSLQNRLREAKGAEGVKHHDASRTLSESLTDSLEGTSGIYWGASCKKNSAISSYRLP